MVKVQNGWQSHTLTELESLTSAPTSPLTSSLRSPRSRPTSSRTLPDRPIFANPSPTAQPHHHTGTQGLDYAYRHPTSPTSGTRTYESFWREHSDPHPSLAPPADIQPRRPLRLHTSTSTSIHTSPSTPTPRKPRTPSQNAAMEKDAVETLVFMSSPKNATYQRGNVLGTPLRRVVGGRGMREREVGGRGMREREVEGGSGESSSEEEEEAGGRMRMRG